MYGINILVLTNSILWPLSSTICFIFIVPFQLPNVNFPQQSRVGFHTAKCSSALFSNLQNFVWPSHKSSPLCPFFVLFFIFNHKTISPSLILDCLIPLQAQYCSFCFCCTFSIFSRAAG